MNCHLRKLTVKIKVAKLCHRDFFNKEVLGQNFSFEILIQSHEKCMVNGASVVTADPEHYGGKISACNKSCVAREVVQTPHCSVG